MCVAPDMEGDTPHADATNPRASFRDLNKRRKWSATALALAVLLAWPLGLLDWRTWQHGYREWKVSRQIRVGMSLKDLLTNMPSPTRTTGRAGTQYVEFENGQIVVMLDFHERVSQVAVKPPAGPGTPNWLIGAGLTLLAAYTGYLWLRDRRPPAGHCPICAYDLRGNVSGRCPECAPRLENTPVVEANAVQNEQPHHDRRGVAYALAAAALFGASTPAAKLLLRDISPLLMAGLLYLGSGVGLGAWSLLRVASHEQRREARLTRHDVPGLLAVVLAGGVAGPALLMWGLARTPASTSSLLLNLEGVITAGLAWFVFRENFDRRIALGMLVIVAGGVLLAWTGTPEHGVPLGVLAIIGACAAWALDNNLTRKISAADPVQIATIKGLVAGAVNIGLGLSSGAAWPTASYLALAGALGLIGYGLSLVLFILGLRHLGSARTGAYFSCAPFVGAVLAMPLLGERPTVSLVAAAILMGVGLWLHLTEKHGHLHGHALIEHYHWHEHDGHHQHAHAPGEALDGCHRARRKVH